VNDGSARLGTATLGTAKLGTAPLGTARLGGALGAAALLGVAEVGERDAADVAVVGVGLVTTLGGAADGASFAAGVGPVELTAPDSVATGVAAAPLQPAMLKAAAETRRTTNSR
jgi:hypothetical protein